MARPMIVTTYDLVQGTFSDSFTARYHCPYEECGAELRSTEDEIGATEHCPTCGTVFQLHPGVLQGRKQADEDARLNREEGIRQSVANKQRAKIERKQQAQAQKQQKEQLRLQAQQELQRQQQEINAAGQVVTANQGRPKNNQLKLVLPLAIVGVVGFVATLLVAMGMLSGEGGTSPVSVVTDVGRNLGLNQQERQVLQEEIESIESALRSSEIRADTVFQQQVGRTAACVKMTAAVAKALGATSLETDAIVQRVGTNEILAKTVFQQLAAHLTGHIEMLGLACAKAGASESEVNLISLSIGQRDTLAETVQQQIAARIHGVMRMAELLAKQLGASTATLEGISSNVSLNDSLSKTVFQQMAARQNGVVKMLGAASIASGAESQSVSGIEQGVSTDDLLADTVQQQLAARLKRSFEMTTVLARAIVVK